MDLQCLWHKTVSVLYNSSLAVKLHMRSSRLLLDLKLQSTGSKLGGQIVLVANSVDSDETPSYLASHPDPSRLQMTFSRV